MRIEKKREAEIEKRKGLTKRTIIAGLWLVISFTISYLVALWLLSDDVLGMDFIYQDIGIPDTVSEVIIRIALAIAIFTMVQFFVLIGYAVASPKAKMRPGTPSMYSSEKDPYDTTIK